MNVRLIHAWQEAGAASLDDLATAINMSGFELGKIFSGNRYPDRGTQQLLADVFKKKVSDLFDEFGGPAVG